MLERVIQFVHSDPDKQTGWSLRRFPVGMVLVLIACWISYFILDRDEYDTDHLLYYHIPDLTRDPLAVLVNLIVTPLVNTQTDQIILITGLLVLFGMPVEYHLGTWKALVIFWVTSSAAALGGGLLLHALYPLFPDVHMFSDGGWYRVFNGASAGGYGLVGAFAATARWPWLWIGLFLIFEPAFWFFLTEDYTTVFHFIAFATGLLFGRYWR